MVNYTWLALAVLCAGTARGAGPSYSAAGIVNASSFTAGPFAPNSVMSIFGSGLARSTHAVSDADLVYCPYSLRAARCLPLELNYVRVFVEDQPVPLLFVSEGQVNFLISNVVSAGPVKIRVANESYSGPEITVMLADAAPALFPNPLLAGYVIAQDAKGKLLTADSPAHAGDIVVIYVTGLGLTSPNPAPGELPGYAATMVAFTALKVTLNGTAVDRTLIKYAGVTPQSAGLYQINLELPKGTGDDPEIKITAGDQAGQSGLKLPVR